MTSTFQGLGPRKAIAAQNAAGALASATLLGLRADDLIDALLDLGVGTEVGGLAQTVLDALTDHVALMRAIVREAAEVGS